MGRWGDMRAPEVEIAEPPVKKSKKVKHIEVEEGAEGVDEEKIKRKEEKAKRKQAAAEAAVAAEEPAAADAEKIKRKEQKAKRKQAAADAAAAAEEPAEEEAPRKKKKTDAAAAEEEDTELIDAASQVFVGGLPFSCTQDALRAYFSECGDVRTLKLPPGKGMNKHNRGIAFITFGSTAGIRKALKLNGKNYEGNTLRVSVDQKAGQPKKERVSVDQKAEQPKKEKGSVDQKEDQVTSDKGTSKGKGDSALRVFVAGLPFQATEAILRKDFGECGEIESFAMPMNEEGRPRGIAFIGYKTQEGLDKALAFEGTEYGGRTLNVSKAVKDKDCKGKAKGKGKDKGS